MLWAPTFSRSKAGTYKALRTPTLQNQVFLAKVNSNLIYSSNKEKAKKCKFFKCLNRKNIWLITLVKNSCIIRTAMKNIILHLESRPLEYKHRSTSMFYQTLSNKIPGKAMIKQNSSISHRFTHLTRSLQSMLIIIRRWVAVEEEWAMLGLQLTGARSWEHHHHQLDQMENSWN